MVTHKQIVQTWGLLSITLLINGCSRPWSIHVQGEDSLCNNNIRVDIVGINVHQKENWMSKSLSLEDYWRGLDKGHLRANAQKDGCIKTDTLRQKTANICKVTVPEKDKIWKKWKEREATHFVVLVDQASMGENWRMCLPLKRTCWQGKFLDRAKNMKRQRIKDNQIVIHIRPSGIVPDKFPIEGCE